MKIRETRQLSPTRLDARRQSNTKGAPIFHPASPFRVLACLAILSVMPVSVGISRGQSGSSSIPPAKDIGEIRVLQNPRFSTNPLDDNASNDPALERKRLAELNALRKKELNSDTEKLLALATELKTEMDKTGKDTLSLDVVRKAEAIEKLAKSVKQKMKATIGG